MKAEHAGMYRAKLVACENLSRAAAMIMRNTAKLGYDCRGVLLPLAELIDQAMLDIQVHHRIGRKLITDPPEWVYAAKPRAPCRRLWK